MEDTRFYQDSRTLARQYVQVWDVVGHCNPSQDGHNARLTNEMQGPFFMMLDKSLLIIQKENDMWEFFLPDI